MRMARGEGHNFSRLRRAQPKKKKKKKKTKREETALSIVAARAAATQRGACTCRSGGTPLRCSCPSHSTAVARPFSCRTKVRRAQQQHGAVSMIEHYTFSFSQVCMRSLWCLLMTWLWAFKRMALEKATRFGRRTCTRASSIGAALPLANAFPIGSEAAQARVCRRKDCFLIKKNVFRAIQDHATVSQIVFRNQSWTFFFFFFLKKLFFSHDLLNSGFWQPDFGRTDAECKKCLNYIFCRNVWENLSYSML